MANEGGKRRWEIKRGKGGRRNPLRTTDPQHIRLLVDLISNTNAESSDMYRLGGSDIFSRAPGLFGIRENHYNV